jgi:hypothetical protein
MTKDEALDLAQKALEDACGNRCNAEYNPCFQREAITAIKASREIKDEPVAVVSGYFGGQCVVQPLNTARIFNSGTAFYTTPPQRKPLTDEPVAWWIPKAEQFCLQNPSGERPFAKAWEPLYATPPQRTWVGLTDEERGQVYADWRFNGGNSSNLELCRAIENKLKELNT